MARLGSPDLNASFHKGALPNTGGLAAINGQVLGVEFLTTDPSLVSGVPRIWFNLTSNELKITDDGVNKYTVGPYTPST